MELGQTKVDEQFIQEPLRAESADVETPERHETLLLPVAAKLEGIPREVRPVSLADGLKRGDRLCGGNREFDVMLEVPEIVYRLVVGLGNALFQGRTFELDPNGIEATLPQFAREGSDLRVDLWPRAGAATGRHRLLRSRAAAQHDARAFEAPLRTE